MWGPCDNVPAWVTSQRHNHVYLSVDILQSAMKGQESKALSPGGHSIPILTTSPIRAPPPKVEGAGQHDHGSEGASILDGIRHLWACIRGFHPKEARTHGLSHISTPQTRRFPQTGEYLLQVGTPDEGEMDDSTPEEVHATYFPTTKTPGPSGNVPLLDIAHLWEEANKALGDWMEIKSSIDEHQWKLVSEFGMTLCQNKSKTKESTKEAKALHTHSIREAETNCAHSI